VSIQISVGSGHGFVLNHFTAPQVLIRTAVNASCALPGLMEPTALLAKDEATGELTSFHPPGVSAFDGTITADIPSARLTELFNCNNFVVSQVNPHVNFVLHLAEEGTGRRGSGRRGRSYDRRAAVTKLLRVANFLLLNIKYGAQKLLEVDLLNLRMVRTLQGILVQDFRGHITVLPELRVKDYVRVLQQPSAEDMAAFIAAGERATWPHVEAIRASTAAEIALTEAATALRGRAREIDERLRFERTRVGDRVVNAGTASTAASPSEVSEENGGIENRAGDVGDVAARDGSGTCTPQDDSFITQSDSASDREPSSGEDDAHLGAGLSCAVESAAWH
jgi:TAG lipase/steryl ester hydrolase/phospholipase A2/LPA acyltransferase